MEDSFAAKNKVDKVGIGWRAGGAKPSALPSQFLGSSR